MVRLQGNSSAQPPYTVHHPLSTAVRQLDCSPRCRRGRCSTWLRGRVLPAGEGRSRYGGFHRGHIIFRGVGLGRRLSGREGLGAVSLNLQGGLCTSRRCTAGTGMTSTRRAPRRSGIASTPGAAASRARAPTPGRLARASSVLNLSRDYSTGETATSKTVCRAMPDLQAPEAREMR